MSALGDSFLAATHAGLTAAAGPPDERLLAMMGGHRAELRDGCAFCDYAGPSEVLRWFNLPDCELYGYAFVIEPLNPVTPGHRLVIPVRHEPDAAISPPLTGHVMRCAVEEAVLCGYEDFNLITSVGAAATQTVGHLHVHVVPRRAGDGLALPWSAVEVVR